MEPDWRSKTSTRTSAASLRSSMVIGIDAHLLLRDQPTGVPRYARELLFSMMKTPLATGERVILYGHKPKPDWLDLPDGWTWKIIRWPLHRGWTHGGLSLEMLIHPPDVLFVPGHELPALMRKRKTKLVTTVHDIAFRAMPDLYSKREVMRQEFALRRALRAADRLIAVSHATADDLMRLCGVAQDQITVIHEATRPDQFAEREGDLGGYVLTIGRVERKKNIAMLVEAFTQFKKNTGSTSRLKIAGLFGFGAEEVLRSREASPFKDEIELLGFVPDNQLPDLLARANAYAFPSRYEGFGIPALEAMASGVPVIASDIPALRETAGDAALFASPHDADAWAACLAQVEQDASLRSDLVQKGREQVRRFSWDQAAKKTWALLRDV